MPNKKNTDNRDDARRAKIRSVKIARAISRNSNDADFLVHAIAEDLAPRIAATNREFNHCADFVSPSNAFANKVTELENVKAISSFSNLMDQNNFSEKFELAISAIGLHWQHDLPNAFEQIFSSLKPDGLFIAAIPIAGTLKELRDCLTLAELEKTNGAALRVDPFLELKKCGDLLQMAGFKLPVIDRETITVRYDNMTRLIEDLRSMGVTNSPNEQTPFIGRDIFERASKIYGEKYSDSDGRVRATFDFAYLTAWTPHNTQQQPLKPGSAVHKLADGLKGNI